MKIFFVVFACFSLAIAAPPQATPSALHACAENALNTSQGVLDNYLIPLCARGIVCENGCITAAAKITDAFIDKALACMEKLDPTNKAAYEASKPQLYAAVQTYVETTMPGCFKQFKNNVAGLTNCLRLDVQTGINQFKSSL